MRGFRGSSLGLGRLSRLSRGGFSGLRGRCLSLSWLCGLGRGCFRCLCGCCLRLSRLCRLSGGRFGCLCGSSLSLSRFGLRRCNLLLSGRLGSSLSLRRLRCCLSGGCLGLCWLSSLGLRSSLRLGLSLILSCRCRSCCGSLRFRSSLRTSGGCGLARCLRRLGLGASNCGSSGRLWQRSSICTSLRLSCLLGRRSLGLCRRGLSLSWFYRSRLSLSRLGSCRLCLGGCSRSGS